MTSPAGFVWTLGHSRRRIAEFLEVLAAHGIETVADVRRYAGARRHPQYHRAALARALARRGVAYLELPELGGRREAVPSSRNTAWRNAAFRGYAGYMETPAFAAGAARLLEAARGSRTAVLCAEAPWWRCHRSLLADHLKAAGADVRHILDSGASQTHPYTAAARVIGGKLTYREEAGRRSL
jgi:uncharacterized protein (DUF488 family)